MLRPLLLLSTLITLTGGEQVFSAPSEFDIRSCPITLYGQKYERVFVNFTTENLVICFQGFFTPGNTDDCVFGPPSDSESAGFEIYPRIPVLETIVSSNVPSIQNQMDCFFTVSFQYHGTNSTLAVIKFGSLSVLYVYVPAQGSVVIDVRINGKTIDSLTVENTPKTRQTRGYLDMSGCRGPGTAYKAGSEVKSPETCVTITCNESLGLLTSTCAPLEHCLGNGSCVVASMSEQTSNLSMNFLCTVMGPTVINTDGLLSSVPDRCTYLLLSIPSDPHFQILANFQDRRRKDVSFLDSVMLLLDEPGVRIHLKQGGRVLLDDSELSLNSSDQMVHGVELHKDQSGISATVSLPNITTSVFFDGYTAQIHLEGSAGSSLQGLCGNSSRSWSELRLPEYNSISCEVQHTDSNDSSINCTKAIERCNLLKEAPFTSCGIDPEPYIIACTDTLCRYPAVDGLNCQVLEAYARVCSLYSNTTLEGWRSQADCPSPGVFCQDRTCSDHEFCGEKTGGGETRCFCRAVFASSYRENNTLGDPTVCSQNSASLTLVNCLLEDKDIDYSALHLNDPTCRGQMDNQSHLVTFSFNSSGSCGTEVTVNSSNVIYKNFITDQNSSNDIITYKDQFYIGFSCAYILYEQTNSKVFRIRSSSAITFVISGLWNYTLTMRAFTDPGQTRVVESSTEVQLNQKIWVELKTDGLDGNLISMVTDSCWATSQESENGSLRYDLIMNGCGNPADQTVKVERNGEGTSSFFSFNMFQFSGTSGDVYLHCRMQLCIKQEDNCVPVLTHAPNTSTLSTD
ncbi:alpha-tectorin-like [Nematolebias whitei]|uniref:alpha-tectorin-like n=1 Tax=Nematolebias whitei TaxID=451745 RepID=UPI0018992026|nr:alpha-tectorin-like [Nematolebias whitei]